MGGADVSAILVEGGVPLMGTVRIKGAKNAVLPIMAASLLTEEEIILNEVPDLEDVRTMSRLLRHLGVDVFYDRSDERLVLKAQRITSSTAPYGPVRRMRASILIAGPLLARMGRVRLSLPGGCAIGLRPIDLHLKGLAAMGATFVMKNGYIEASAPKLRGANICLDYPSVGATENLLMAAALAEGPTTIENAAAEPDVVDLAAFIDMLGAKVRGAGTPRISVQPVRSPGGGKHSVIPDRIEAGTFMVAAAITGGDILLENVISRHLTAVTAKLRECGVHVDETPDSLHVVARGRPRAVELKTMPYPGFPTDLQPQFMALLSVARGTSVIAETVFERRYLHVPALQRMGARIHLEGHKAIISGSSLLQGTTVYAPDLRGGAALVLAAMAARGVSEIHGVRHIRRGYSRLTKRLRALGGRVYMG